MTVGLRSHEQTRKKVLKPKNRVRDNFMAIGIFGCVAVIKETVEEDSRLRNRRAKASMGPVLGVDISKLTG